MDEHEVDNVMPNEGSVFYPHEPKQQAIDRKKERARTLEALPILKDLLKRLEQRITFYESIYSIPEEVRTDPQQFLIVHNANTLMVQNLKAEAEWIQDLLENAMPKS
jgi:hypothetical protein